MITRVSIRLELHKFCILSHLCDLSSQIAWVFKWVKSPKFQIDRSLPKTEDTSAKKVSLLHPAQFWTPSPPLFPVTALSAAGARAGGASRVRRPAGCPRGTTEAGDPEQGCRAGRGRSSASLRERRRLVWGRAARANCLARPSWSPSWSPRRTGPAVQCSADQWIECEQLPIVTRIQLAQICHFVLATARYYLRPHKNSMCCVSQKVIYI